MAGFAVFPVNIMTWRRGRGPRDFKETEGLVLHLVAPSLKSYCPLLLLS